MGELITYLLTVDYVYAGLVERPTLEEMAQVINKLNSRAAIGLEKLFLIPMSPRTEAKVVRGKKRSPHHKQVDPGIEVPLIKTALQLIMDYLMKNFSAEEQAMMRLDWFIIEHSLCKYSRLQKTLQEI